MGLEINLNEVISQAIAQVTGRKQKAHSARLAATTGGLECPDMGTRDMGIWDI